MFIGITVVFVYTTITNMFERPEGIKIASLFIVTHRRHLARVAGAAVNRAARDGIRADEMAAQFIETTRHAGDALRIIAHRPGDGSLAEYERKLAEATDTHHLPSEDPVLFLEVSAGDASQFSEMLMLEGVRIGPYRVLRCRSAAIPNAIAALLLYIRDRTGQIPHVYFGWTEGNPISYLLKFLAFGEGDTAPVTREVLRQSDRIRSGARACTSDRTDSSAEPAGRQWSVQA